MPEVEINDLGMFGVVRDKPSYMLPPEAWSLGTNVRYVADGVEALRGWEDILAGNVIAPHFAMPLRTTAQNFWLYTSLTEAAAYDGATHAVITRTSGGGYSSSETKNWNGTLLANIPILNNGVDVPQYWPAPNTAVQLADLPNWPSGLRAAVIRSLGPFLVAVGLTDSGQSLPHTIQWSHPAEPGTIPISWDYTDPTLDTGRIDLPDVDAGVILEAWPLQSSLYIYKEGSVHRLTFIGGRSIFDRKNFLDSVGILAPRCVCTTPDGTKHAFATQDDIMWHDGRQAGSLLERADYQSLKRRIFSEMDQGNYRNSFMFANPLYNEVWFCYPSEGHSNPDKGVIINLSRFPNTIVSEIDGVIFRNAAIGQIETPTSGIWSDPGTWDEDVEPWATVSRRKVLLSVPDNANFALLDSPQQTRHGAAYTATLRREGLSIIGKKRNGEWIEDYSTLKLLQSVWPKVQGDPVNVRFGVQEDVGGTTTWSVLTPFDPDADIVVYPIDAAGAMMSGRGISIEFSSSTANFWRLDGYKLELETLGRF